MKKSIAVLISLLFVTSVFGIASVGATVNGHCDCEIVGPAYVQVGDEFDVITTMTGTFCCFDFEIGGDSEVVKYISTQRIYPSPGSSITTVRYKALRPGTFSGLVSCGTISNCHANQYDVIVLKKALPMDKFMKIFGLGQKD